MKIGTEPKIEKIPELKDLELKMPSIPGIDNVENGYTESFDVKFNNIPIKIEVTSTSSFIINGVMSRLGKIVIEIKVSTKDKKYLSSIMLYFRKDADEDETYEAFTNVANQGDELKGQGLGRALWEMSLKLIQKFANKFNGAVVHDVERSPKQGLSQEKWNELFLPLLEKYSYTHNRGNEWKLRYLPKKK